MSAMLTGKFLQIWKVFATSSLLAEEFPDTLQCKVPDIMQSVRIKWKASGRSEKCPVNLENVSGESKKSVDNLESFCTI